MIFENTRLKAKVATLFLIIESNKKIINKNKNAKKNSCTAMSAIKLRKQKEYENIQYITIFE